MTVKDGRPETLEEVMKQANDQMLIAEALEGKSDDFADGFWAGYDMSLRFWGESLEELMNRLTGSRK